MNLQVYSEYDNGPNRWFLQIIFYFCDNFNSVVSSQSSGNNRDFVNLIQIVIFFFEGPFTFAEIPWNSTLPLCQAVKASSFNDLNLNILIFS